MSILPSSIGALVTIEWLFEHLNDPDIILLDASIPKVGSSSTNDSIQIKRARFFDIDGAFSDTSVDLPHIMPFGQQFEKAAQSLGINRDSLLIVYDEHGIYSSPRAWWMIKSMGHERVAVLDGGLPEWIKAGFPVEKKRNRTYSQGNFIANLNEGFFANSKQVLEQINDHSTALIDARSAGRFNGKEPEPRPGLRSGHIPNSLNLPFTEVLDGHHIKPKEDLAQIFDQLNIVNKRLIFSCGSGLTACIILLAAYISGHSDLSVYDGSWSEWGQPCELPVE